MKKLTVIAMLVATFVLAMALVGCSSSSDETDATSSNDASPAADFEIDYGTSDLYTQEDMDAAIDTIMAEFSTWKGATMQRVFYTDDATCESELPYLNGLAKDGISNFDQAIVFKSDFHSPSGEDAEGTAWSPDTDYTDYEWYLARVDGGDWKLITFGY